MFTPGSAGGQSVLVWEGPAALRTAGAQVGAGGWCDKVAPVVVSYHTGGKNRSSSGLPGEMTRQLDGQFTALSLMSAKEILAGMATFDERKRSPASHTRIRKDFQDKLAKSLERRHHFPPEVAGLWASRAMGELAVLHNPDQLLSGPQGPSLVGGVVALGDRATNSAVGAQTAQGPRELIRDAAQAAVDAGQGDRLLHMRVVLTDSPDLSRDLNERLKALEPRSLAEQREAVSPRGPPLTPQVLSDRLAQALGGDGGLEDLTRDELRQALTQPPPQTPDHPDTPTPNSLNTPTPDGMDAGAPDMTGPDGLDAGVPDMTGPDRRDAPGLDGSVPETGAPDRGAPGAPVSAPVAGQPASGPVEPVARPTDTSPSMSAPTPDLNAPDRNAPDRNALDTAAPDRSAPEQNAHEQNRPDRVAPEASAPDRAAPEQTRPDKATPDAGAPDGRAPGGPGRSAPNAGAPDGDAPGSPGRGAPNAGAPDGGAPGSPTQVPGVGRTTPPSAPPVSEPPARSQQAASPTTPKQPAQPGRQNQPAQPGQPGQPSGQPGRQGQSGRQVRSGRSGVPGRGAAGAGTSGAPGVTARPEAPSRLQAGQGTGTPPAPARPGPQAGPQAPAGQAQPAPRRSTTARTAGDSTPGRSTSGRVGGPTAGDTPSRRVGGRGTNTTPRTTPGSASRSASRSAGATASGARAASQDPIKARMAPTGDPKRDAALAGISSKLDKLRQHNQQRQPTQAPTRTTPTHHPRR